MTEPRSIALQGDAKTQVSPAMKVVLGLQLPLAVRSDHFALLRTVAVMHRVAGSQRLQRARDELTALRLTFGRSLTRLPCNSSLANATHVVTRAASLQ